MAAYISRFYNSVMKKLLLVLCASLVLILAPLVGKPHEWTNKQGKTIKAGFVSAGEEAVTISMRGKSYVVQLADLSPQSPKSIWTILRPATGSSQRRLI